MIGTAALALAAALQGDAGVLPASPVPPLMVASGGTAAATGRLGGVFLNPANATGARGLELGVVSYPRTRLQGFSIVAAGGRRLRVVAGLWSYSLTDIFDADLIAQDPSLRELGLSMAAGSVGAAFTFGRLSLGALIVARTQNIVGTHTAAASVSAGTRLELGAFELAASLVDAPWSNARSAAAPSSALSIGAAASRAFWGVTMRLEVNAWLPRADFRDLDYGVSPRIQWGPLEFVWGYSGSAGWSGGASLRHERLRFEAATNFVGRERLDQRIALSVSVH